MDQKRRKLAHGCFILNGIGNKPFHNISCEQGEPIILAREVTHQDPVQLRPCDVAAVRIPGERICWKVSDMERDRPTKVVMGNDMDAAHQKWIVLIGKIGNLMPPGKKHPILRCKLEFLGIDTDTAISRLIP